jgi:hypothetical protein
LDPCGAADGLCFKLAFRVQRHIDELLAVEKQNSPCPFLSERMIWKRESSSQPNPVSFDDKRSAVDLPLFVEFNPRLHYW